MSKTWKKRNKHINHIGNWRNKGEEYGHNWRPNAYRRTFREYAGITSEEPLMRRKSLPDNPYVDKKSGGRVKPTNSRFIHGRSQYKLKQKRLKFENGALQKIQRKERDG